MKRHILWLERLNIIKICVFPQLIVITNEIPIKISTVFLMKLDKLILNFYIKQQKPKTRQNDLKKNKNKIR